MLFVCILHECNMLFVVVLFIFWSFLTILTQYLRAEYKDVNIHRDRMMPYFWLKEPHTVPILYITVYEKMIRMN